MAAHPEVLAYLVEGAKRRGIDPNVVVKAFGHEGLNVFDPNKPDRGGDEGSSFGPYQLHYKGMSKSMPNAGMGDDFTRKTGLDARDPSTWKAQTDFVLDHLANGGTWKPWMGAAAEGITGRMGLPGGSNAPAPQRPDAKSPQEAIDAAGPGSRYNVPHQGPNALSGGAAPVQGPNLPAGWTPQQQPNRSTLADLLKGGMKSFGGFASGATANQPALSGADLRPGPAARVSAQNVTSVDPQAALLNDQRMQLAMARLNSGQLWT